jgi:hypothetical protein
MVALLLHECPDILFQHASEPQPPPLPLEIWVFLFLKWVFLSIKYSAI